MWLRMENVNILGVHWKFRFLRGGSRKTNIEDGGLSEKGGGTWTVCRFKGGGLDILHMFSCLVCTWFQHLLYKFKRHCKLHLNYHPMKDLLAFASGHLVKFCNFYPQLSLEIVFLALKLTHFISWKLAI